ncbi:MAG: DUF58 domain-containing protein [Acidiferrobacterales bacterium]|nr:DUF58 domain-containing protein [Acidiferrobacterales bacterium]
MSVSPDTRSRAPSERLWTWFQSLTRNAVAGQDGVFRIQGKQIYILPTGYGVLFSIMLLGMLFGANNYGSNPGFLFTFLLTGLGLAALFQTWKNLLGLELVSVSCQPVFCGQNARFELTLRNPFTTPRAGISGYLWRTQKKPSPVVDLAPMAEETVVIEKPTTQRGEIALGRIALTTRYPLGLLKSWAYIQIDEPCLVYPKIASIADGIDHANDSRVAKISIKQDGDDFAGHKPYQDGDNVMHVDWKAVARGKGWNLKNFEQHQGEDVWLRWEAASQGSIEENISAITCAIVELENSGKSYGLAIPGETIHPGIGANHRHRCLKALALLRL